MKVSKGTGELIQVELTNDEALLLIQIAYKLCDLEIPGLPEVTPEQPSNGGKPS